MSANSLDVSADNQRRIDMLMHQCETDRDNLKQTVERMDAESKLNAERYELLTDKLDRLEKQFLKGVALVVVLVTGSDQLISYLAG